MQHTGTVTGAVLIGVLALGTAVPAEAATPTYRTSYAKFHVAFPKAPTSQSNTKAIMSGFPTGTVSSATAYWVSPVANPLTSSTNGPPSPTYLVVVGKATSAKKAQNFVDAVKTLSGSKAVSVGGAKGYTFSAVAKKVEGSSGATDPNATEGLLYVSKGNTIYSVDVIDDNGARARAFLKSFSPA